MPTTTFGNEFTINVEGSGNENIGVSVVLADGRVLFVWWSDDPDVDGSGSGIAARVGTVQPDGGIVWGAAGEITLNEETQTHQAAPSATQLPDGRVLVTWSSLDPDVDGDSYGISGRIGTVQADGSFVWDAAGEFTINEEAQGLQSGARAYTISGGRLLTVWYSDDPDVDGNSYGISARVGTPQADGSIVWAPAGEFTVNVESQGNQSGHRLLYLGEDRVLITWSSDDPDIDASYSVVGRIGSVQADGSIAWDAAGEFQINQLEQGYQQAQTATLLADGRVLFTWSSQDPGVDGSDYGIAGRIGTVQPDGSIVWASDEFVINEHTDGLQFRSSVTQLGGGRLLFTWESAAPEVDGNGRGITGRIGVVELDGTITWEGGEFTINQRVVSDQLAATTHLLPDGRVVIAWMSNDPAVDGASYGITGRVVSFNMAPAANDDGFAIAETSVITGGNLFADNAAGADDAVDGDAFTITAVNGSALNVGSQITLASGALLTVSANGTFDYDPNGGPEPLYQTPALDSFTYTIDDGFGGTSTATVTITLSSAGQLIVGDYLGNTLNGGVYGDLIIAVGGDDTVNGGDGADALDGGDGGDTLNGQAGGDLLYGRADNDTLNGGDGRDSLFGGDGADVLNGDADDDTLDGGGDADALNGGDGLDTLQGRAGNDTLDGGAGADFMFGGAGDDTYYVDTIGDEASELSASGTDTVIASINYVLPFYTENLTLTGAATNGAGNVLANLITGTSGNNVLQGLGGADTINAGDGADTVYGGDGADQLNGQAGADVIDGGNFDDTLNGGDDNDTLYGRQNNDTLNGDAGADTLYGGDGADTADGGDGDDLVDGGNGDDVLEGGAGADTLYGRQNNDALSGGADNDALYGGDGDDTLAAGDGADSLFGGNGLDRIDGGLGADALNGGSGADTFVFSTTLGAGNIDTVVGFNVADDTIELSTAIFAGIGIGALAANAFVIGSAATTAEHRIIYDATTGALFYDADGDGAGAAVQFATLGTGLALTSADFVGGP